MKKYETSPYFAGPRTFSLSLEKVLARLRGGARTALKGTLAAGLLVPSSSSLLGCSRSQAPQPPPRYVTKSAAFSIDDWVHAEGQANLDMVSYTGAYWTQSTGCSPRGGCTGIDVYLKVRVLKQDNIDLSAKKVGVFCADPFCSATGVTAVGGYFGELGGGWEEWHIPVHRAMWDVGVFTFTAWYQDGKGNTWYDDNAGEGHVAPYYGPPVVIRHDWEQTDVVVSDAGVQGTVTMFLAGLDYDKEVRMTWTTDDWQTANDFVMGPDATNAWHWKEDAGNGFERWEIVLDIAGPATRFEYAVQYNHGVNGSATLYEFWDNNGGKNHVVIKGAYTKPVAP